MGFRDLVLFYIVTGISLRWIATAATVGASAVVIWLIAWCAFYLPLALSVMELSSRYPQEGGLYVWSKRAFGEFPGFITAKSPCTSSRSFVGGAKNCVVPVTLRRRSWIPSSENTSCRLPR
jgi:hypothetical protein